MYYLQMQIHDLSGGSKWVHEELKPSLDLRFDLGCTGNQGWDLEGKVGSPSKGLPG